MMNKKSSHNEGLIWSLKSFKLDDLTSFENNPRKISKNELNKLKRSIQEDGFHQRLLVTQEGKVIGGHQRIKVLKDLGHKEIECLVPNRKITNEEYKRLNIRDNLQAGEWEFDVLANFFDADKLLDWGFPEELLPKQEGVVNEPKGDEDEAGKPPTNPQTVRGDIYEIGPHRLMCGDSTMIDDVDKLMGGVKADMVFTDPPYGVDVVKGGRVGADFGVAKKGEYTPIIGDGTTDTAVESYQICVALGIKNMVFWGGNYYADKLPPSSCWLVWDKRSDSGIVNTFADCELAWTNMTGPARVHHQLWNGMIREGEKEKRCHPTQKPTALAEWALGQFSEHSVLDLFGGSGSTMVAAHKLGRTAYLMELDEKYCDVIVSRMHKLFPELPIKRNGIQFVVKDADNG
jgi:DNA modification methylase